MKTSPQLIITAVRLFTIQGVSAVLNSIIGDVTTVMADFKDAVGCSNNVRGTFGSLGHTSPVGSRETTQEHPT